MNQAQKQAVKKLSEFVSEIKPDLLVDILEKNGTLTSEETAEIKEEEDQPENRSLTLLSCICRSQQATAYDAFIQALQNTNQKALASIVMREFDSITQKASQGHQHATERLKTSSLKTITDYSNISLTLLEEYKNELKIPLTDPMYDKLWSYYKTGALAFEEVMNKFFSKSYKETFLDWPKYEEKADGIAYCRQPTADDPYTVFGCKAEIDCPAELLFRDLVYNAEKIESTSVKFAKRIQWLGSRAVILHVAFESPSIFINPREVVTMNMWRKVGDSYILNRRSIETDLVPERAGLERARLHYCAHRFSPVEGNPNKTVLNAISAGDGGGWVPQWLADTLFGAQFLTQNIIAARARGARVVNEQVSEQQYWAPI
uniref:CARD domain-containing protein n=1 Tax=Plectus sambesii TaxID=2011161 RepID=A0A914UQ44_9BILA